MREGRVHPHPFRHFAFVSVLATRSLPRSFKEGARYKRALRYESARQFRRSTGATGSVWRAAGQGPPLGTTEAAVAVWCLVKRGKRKEHGWNERVRCTTQRRVWRPARRVSVEVMAAVVVVTGPQAVAVAELTISMADARFALDVWKQ